MQAGALLFSANFDSGNLGQVENVQESIEYAGPQSSKTQMQSWADRLVTISGAEKRPLLCSKPDYHVKCWTYPDAHGTPFENGNKSWFHFSVRNYAPGSVIRISIMNVSHQSKVFSQGYTPVFNVMNSVTDDPCWMRITEEPISEVVDGQSAVTFAHRFTQQSGSVTYFAFSYPWTYLDTQLQLKRLENMFIFPMSAVKSTQMTADSAKVASSIYFHRELLCYSLCGRRIDLLTISDNTNKLSELEDRFDPLLFPEQSIPRPHKFAKKKVFLITARVHPGETPGSHMFNGVLEFLLRERDERAIQLRRTYVFKLIPMLNPDGVAMGHHRTDSRGANLNRFYLQPNFLLYPSVYAVKALATYHHLSYASIARYPGCLPSWQFERFVNLAARYRSFTGSAEVSLHSGNLARPPFIPRRKESLGAPIVSVKEMTHDVARELTRTLNAALEGKRPDTGISKPDNESEDAERSPSPHAKSDSMVCYVASKKRVRDGEDQQQSFPDIQCASSGFNCGQLKLRIQAIQRRKDLANFSVSRNCDAIKEASECLQEIQQISDQVPKKSQLGKEGRENAHGDRLSLLPQAEECIPESDSSHSLRQKKSSKPTNGTADGNELDIQMRRLDRVYVNMVARHLKQDGQDVGAKEAFLTYCTGAHLTHPSLRSIGPEESGVKCYIDLHGHCTKRGCFCYGNRLKDDRQMVDNVLYARLVATNSAFFDFSACNFSLRNMYLRDKVNDTTKEGSGRVGIWKHTGITHCYTVEANYTSSRVLNILSATVSDDRCATPPGTLWGPMRGSAVVPKPPTAGVTTAPSFFTYPTSVTSTATDALVGYSTRLAKLTGHGSYVISHDERYTPEHFHEMGRGLLTAALDMWSVNPWSRLATSACADMVRFRPGTYCNLKSLLNNALRFGKLGPVRSGGHVPTKLRQAEVANMKILRNWAKSFVGNTTTNESSEAPKLKEATSPSPRTSLVSHVSAHVPIIAAATAAVSQRRRERQPRSQRLAACPPAAVSDSRVVEAQSLVTAVVPVAVSTDEFWNTNFSKLAKSNVVAKQRICPVYESGINNAVGPLALPENHEREKQPLAPSIPLPQSTDRCVAVVKNISKPQNSNELKPRPIKLIRKRVSLAAPMRPTNQPISRVIHSISTTAVLRPPPYRIAASSVAALEGPAFVPLRPRLRRAERPRRTKSHKKQTLPRLIDFASPAAHHKEVLTASGQMLLVVTLRTAAPVCKSTLVVLPVSCMCYLGFWRTKRECLAVFGSYISS
ncbi:Cytosolic carboxypeptidase-like protein 5 [Echinococcus granulosus]|uniref:Cytosolic carboxypeptidase-like protein 5 n=1 Tax=Echinococcus granulosus TaxID=6210 RepID=W6V2D3_ECHGR|nr:Cytosolic carboxypeptidase-like protein 5 [Echinococcus granulosus]EUB60069.1 Cytosolic carboxypeptidase-like protein 5 [Echinococcus granulosus]